jgi:hypothetical protein
LVFISSLLFVHHLREALERTVKGPFDFRREGASRQFFHLQVVLDTFAALALAAARLISAIAFSFIGFQVAIHGIQILK